MNLAIHDLASEIRETFKVDKRSNLSYISLDDIEPHSLSLKSYGSSDEVQSHKYRFKKGDILFGTLRPYFCKLVVCPFDGVCSTEFSVIRPKDDNDRNFLFFTLAQKKFIEHATVNSNGGRPRTSWKLFSGFSVPYFNKKERLEIGEFLSNYSRLIENNCRQIQLLEQAVRLIYEEWFTRFRFSDYEQTRFIDGLPNEWIKVTLNMICMDIREQIKPSKTSPDTPYIGLEHIPRKSITLSSWGKACDVESSKFKFSKGDLLFGKIRPYLHKIGIALVDGITSSDTIVIRSLDEVNRYYLLSLLSSDEFVSLASATQREGSKMPRADWRFLSQHVFLLPPKNVLNKFNALIEPIIIQLEKLVFSNQKLAQARDLLLPKLINGEIQV